MDTSASNLGSLAARIENLERQNRLYKRGGLALLFLPLPLIVMRQARPARTLEAQSFVLRDAKGNRRAELATFDTGSMLRLYDSTGKFGATIAAVANGVGNLDLSGGASLIVTRSGPAFILGNGNGQGANVSVTEHDLSLNDSNGRQRVKVNAQPPFGPSIELDDEDGFSRASLNLIAGQPLIIVNDSQGYSAQLGDVNLGTTRTGPHSKTSAASIVLYSKDGKVLWSAP